MLQKDIDNLNLRCGSDVTGEEVQEHILVACSIGCILFGMLYGFVLLSDTVGFRKYMLGLWKYENCMQIFIKICIFLLCLFPSMTLALVAKFFLHEVAKYLVTCLAVTLAGVALSYWAPVLAEKCGVIRLLPGYAEQYQEKLDDI